VAIFPRRRRLQSVDGGKTWKNTASKNRAIGRVIINPKNPDVAYVAALASLWPKSERGLRTWTAARLGKKFSQRRKHGAIDIAFDPTMPKKYLFASLWEARRTPGR